MIGLNRAALIVARYKAVRKRALPSRPNWARPRTLCPTHAVMGSSQHNYWYGCNEYGVSKLSAYGSTVVNVPCAELYHRARRLTRPVVASCSSPVKPKVGTVPLSGVPQGS